MSSFSFLVAKSVELISLMAQKSWFSSNVLLAFWLQRLPVQLYQLDFQQISPWRTSRPHLSVSKRIATFSDKEGEIKLY